MQKKATAIVAIILLTLGTLGVVPLFIPTQAVPLDFETMCEGTVDKKPGESFTIKITFKNKGTTEGTWKITVTFEGEDWTWKGEEKQLTLKSYKTKTLTWEGNVPEDVTVDTVARLVVYYDSEFAALNWWIHVIRDAELYIIDSKVS